MHVCPAFAHFPQIIRLAAISMSTVLSMYTGLKKIMYGLRNSQMHPITHNLLICSIQSYVAPVPSNSRPFFFSFTFSSLCITIQLSQFKPTNALNSITITVILQHTSSFKFRASMAHHQRAYNCTKLLHILCT
jgi:hypothetical protein